MCTHTRVLVFATLPVVAGDTVLSPKRYEEIVLEKYE